MTEGSRIWRCDDILSICFPTFSQSLLALYCLNSLILYWFVLLSIFIKCHSNPKKFVADFSTSRYKGRLGKGMGGVTPIQKKSLQILVPPEKKRNIVFRNEGGGSEPIWKFSEISSILANPGAP